VSAKFSDTDKGYKDLVKRVYGIERPTVDVGVLDAGGGLVYPDGTATILDVAIWNEFGTKNIPSRSFIREWFDENEDQLRADLRVLMESVVAGKRTKEQILEIIGQRAVAQIQERISSSIPPPNARSTVRQKKGSETTLVDTGLLRSSVTYKVKEG
jgi:hypothetical protein